MSTDALYLRAMPLQFSHESYGRILSSLLTILAMKKLIFTNDSVTETAGVYEDLAAVQELQTNESDTDTYFIEEDSMKDCTTSDTRVRTSSATAKS